MRLVIIGLGRLIDFLTTRNAHNRLPADDHSLRHCRGCAYWGLSHEVRSFPTEGSQLKPAVGYGFSDLNSLETSGRRSGPPKFLCARACPLFRDRSLNP